MAHDSAPDANPHQFLNTILLMVFLVVIAGLAAVIVTAPEVPPVSEDSFRTVVEIDEKRLAEERAYLYGQVDLAKAADKVATLRESVRATNELQFGGENEKAQRDAAILNTYNANEVLAEIDLEGVMVAGEEVFDACLDGFAELQRALSAKSVTPAQVRTDPGPDFDAYRKNCGNAFPVLEQINVVRSNGEWVDPRVGPQILDIMNRLRWASILDMRKPPHQQLTPYAYEILTRWRASNDTFPVAKRQQWVAEAARELPGLLAAEIVGNLHFEAGDRELAQEAYDRACKQKKNDLYLQARCAWLRSAPPR